MAEEDEAAARRRGGPARDRRLRGGRRRLNGDGDGDGADDGPRRARGGRRARGRREEEARGRGAEAGEQCGKRSWSSHLPVAMGWIDLTADMGLLREGERIVVRYRGGVVALLVSTNRSFTLRLS